MRTATEGVRPQGSGHGSAGRRIVWLALLAAITLPFLFARPAQAAGAVLQPCGKNLTCGRVWVPLDPTGRVPGQVGLFVERYARTPNPTGGTVIALAGGPGQSGVDLLSAFTDDLAPILGNRALVVFDQRGVGRSGDLTCRASSHTGSTAWVSGCAGSLGPRRAFYSTANSVADIDAVRNALGLQQVSVEGVSYGTFTALAYARAYPAQVDRLVLDSSLPAAGDTGFELNSVVAMRRLLGQLCAAGCPGMTPSQDLVTLLGRPPSRVQFDGHRSTITSTLAGESVYEALLTSDLHPFVRASIPAALHLAATGDLNALVRLSQVSYGIDFGRHPVHPAHPLLPGASLARATSVDVDYLATICDDAALPWSSSDPVPVRQAKLQAAIGALSVPSFQPFDRETIADEAFTSLCLGWPEAGDAPTRISNPLPAVPTLVLSGEDDIRTPLEDATILASQLPTATLVKVPNTGHAVLGSDESGCAKRALAAFFASQPIDQCAVLPPDAIDPLPPALARLAVLPVLRGTPGRVLRASVLTLRHDIGLVGSVADPLGYFVGTRSGYARVTRKHRRYVYTLKGLSYVNGVSLTGRLSNGRGRQLVGSLAVRLRGRRYGEITLETGGKISGKLGGRAFRITAAARERINRQGGLTAIPLG